MSLHSFVIQAIARRFHSERMAIFVSAFDPNSRVIDLGGTPHLWHLAPKTLRVTLVNLDAANEPEGFAAVCADAKACPFPNRSFDVVFSNSLIEHLDTWEAQQQFAVEVRRLAPHYFIQTPNKWFPIEPHVLAPLVQFLPRRIVPWVSAWLTPIGWLAPSRRWIQDNMRVVRLLSERELRVLFPDAIIVREKFLGLTKSLIAISPR